MKVIRLDRSDLSSPSYQWLFATGDIEKRRRYAKWMFEENTALQQSESLPIYVCKDDTVDLGRLAIIPVKTVFNGSTVRGGWCVDFFVNYQRRGIGKRLLDAAHQDFSLLMTLGQTDAAFGLFSKLGWHDGGRLTHYKILLGRRFILKHLAIKAGLLRKGKSRPQKQPGQSKIPPREFERPVLRTPAFLQWRYDRHPFIKYSCMKPLDLHEVYIIWRVTDNGLWHTAMVVDILHDDVSLPVMKTALKAFMRRASSCGAQILECQTSDPFVLKALPNTFLSVRNPGIRFLYSMDGSPFVSVDHWRLYAGDCDVESRDFDI